MKISIKNALTFGDYHMFNKWYNRSIYLHCLYAVLFLLIISNLILGDLSDIAFIFRMILYAACPLLAMSLMKLYLYFKCKSIYNSDSTLRFERVITIDNEKIIEEDKCSKSEYTWDLIIKIVEYKGNYYLLLGQNRAIILPRKCITEELKIILKSIKK